MVDLSYQIRQFLNEPHFAVVSTIAPDGMPHQTVMWYELAGDELLLNTPFDSLKHKQLRRDPRISVCVEQGYRYVTLTGTVKLNEDPEQARADYAQLGNRYRGTLAAIITAPRTDGRTSDLLSRARVTLHMTIMHVISNGVE
ncbi:MAG: PPOX class F420-dependent oxidoreductase [Chloroflexi bacterium]|nr:PPOX class F420-dependent oxidoreductase [Chloroflexota bacterium]